MMISKHHLSTVLMALSLCFLGGSCDDGSGDSPTEDTLTGGSDTGSATDSTSGGADVLADAAPGTPRFLCESTGGTWEATDTGDCEHAVCGTVGCDDIVTHSEYCVCDVRARFDETDGCTYEPACLDSEQNLCEATGGTWNPSACMHDICGMPSGCKAIIPGCECGPGKIFDPPGIGCVESTDCN